MKKYESMMIIVNQIYSTIILQVLVMYNPVRLLFQQSIIEIIQKKSYKMKLLFSVVNDADVLKQNDSLKCKTSSGNDGVSDAFLKTIKMSIIRPFTVVINKRI